MLHSNIWDVRKSQYLTYFHSLLCTGTFFNNREHIKHVKHKLNTFCSMETHNTLFVLDIQTCPAKPALQLGKVFNKFHASTRRRAEGMTRGKKLMKPKPVNPTLCLLSSFQIRWSLCNRMCHYLVGDAARGLWQMQPLVGWQQLLMESGPGPAQCSVRHPVSSSPPLTFNMLH